MKIDSTILFFFVALNGAAAFFLMASKLLALLERSRRQPDARATAEARTPALEADAPAQVAAERAPQVAGALGSLFETFEPEEEPAPTRGEERLARNLERWREEGAGGEKLPDAAGSCRTERVA